MGVVEQVHRVRHQVERGLSWLESQIDRRSGGYEAAEEFPDPAVAQALKRFPPEPRSMPDWCRYGAGMGATVVAAIITWLLLFWFGWDTPVAFPALATTVVVWRWGAGPALISILCSVAFLTRMPEPQFRIPTYLILTGCTGLLTHRLTCVVTQSRSRLRALARALEDQRQLEHRVGETAKMEALGRLAGGVAHDFNNSLFAILSMGELVQRQPDLSDQSREDLKEIIASARRATDLTRQLLTFSRHQATAPEPVNVSHATARLLPMVRRLLPGNITVKVVDGESVGTVLMDPSYFEQLLVNLVVNARDAMASGGTISLAIATVETDHQPDLSQLPKGRYTHLQVEDTGCGMDAVTLRHIFEPFFTTKPIGKGTGFGLATVYNLVQRVGGQIEVRSQLNRGTRFDIFLPETEMPEPVEAETLSSPTNHRGRLLLVEDDDGLRRILCRMLRAYGYDVLEAENGTRALDLLNQDGIDVMITDVVMPEVGGRELANRARKIHQRLPIVFMSGWADDEVLARGIRQGEALFLQKPFRPDALLNILQEVIPAS